MQFKKGDRVQVVSSEGFPEFKKYVGRTGTLKSGSVDNEGVLAVQGLESKLNERLHGYACFLPSDLQKV